MRWPTAVLLLGLIPPTGAVLPSAFRLHHPAAQTIFWFGIVLASVWLLAYHMWGSGQKLGLWLVRATLLAYLLTGLIGIVRFEASGYVAGASIIVPWLVIWFVIPVCAWIISGRPVWLSDVNSTAAQHGR